MERINLNLERWKSVRFWPSYNLSKLESMGARYVVWFSIHIPPFYCGSDWAHCLGFVLHSGLSLFIAHIELRSRWSLASWAEFGLSIPCLGVVVGPFYSYAVHFQVLSFDIDYIFTPIEQTWWRHFKIQIFTNSFKAFATRTALMMVVRYCV